MKIKRIEDSVILYLNKDLYNENAVDSIMRDFADLCKISKKDGNGYHLVHFCNLETEELEEVAMAFSNHALALMKGA
jgi:hypothetical protein